MSDKLWSTLPIVCSFRRVFDSEFLEKNEHRFSLEDSSVRSLLPGLTASIVFELISLITHCNKLEIRDQKSVNLTMSSTVYQTVSIKRQKRK